MSRFRSAFIATLVAVSFASGARAADLAYPQIDGAPVTYQPVQFASGWYLRGDVGWEKNNLPKLNADGTLLATTDNRNSWTAGFGIGYQWNDWIRTDATLDYSHSIMNSISTTQDIKYGQPTIICPYGLTPVATNGYLYDTTNTCRNDMSAKQTRLTALFNAYVDLGHWYGVTPYVGAGIGVTGTQIRGSSAFFETANGQPYAPNLTNTSGGTIPSTWVTAAGTPATVVHPVAFAQQNWNTSTRQRLYRFAWSLTGGFAYDIAPHMKIDVNYRYVNLGSYQVVDTNGAVQNKTASTQDVRVGLRWTPDL